eukprot:gene22749-29915_t
MQKLKRSYGCPPNDFRSCEAALQPPAGTSMRSGKSAARKQGKIIPKVKVESAVVRAVSGDRAPSAAEKYETTAVGVLFFLFANIIIFGLVLAGSGFLPEEYDDFATLPGLPKQPPSS